MIRNEEIDKAIKQNNTKLCQNCSHFKMCKLYDRTATTLVQLFGEEEPPYDPNFLAERCNEFRPQLSKTTEKLFTT